MTMQRFIIGAILGAVVFGFAHWIGLPLLIALLLGGGTAMVVWFRLYEPAWDVIESLLD